MLLAEKWSHHAGERQKVETPRSYARLAKRRSLGLLDQTRGSTYLLD